MREPLRRRSRRRPTPGMLVLLLLPVGLFSTACDPAEDGSSNVPITTQPTTRRAPASNPFAAVTRPTTAATTHAAAADDPLVTPPRAVAYMFELMSKEDIDGLRAIMAEPIPAATLRGEVRGVADRLAGGAKWEVADTKISGIAALVIVRTTLADGKLDFSPLVLVNRYERWKVILGTPTQAMMRRFTVGEKESMNRVLEWGVTRMSELRGAPTTRATTAPSSAPITP